VPPKLVGKALRLPYVLIRRRMQNRYRIELHYTASFGRRLRLSDQGGIVIFNRVRIGDDCEIGQGVTIGKTGHAGEGCPELGDRVVVGPGAVIAGNLRVGDDAVIGPNSVVLTSVPSSAVVSARSAEIHWPRGAEAPVEPQTGVGPADAVAQRKAGATLSSGCGHG
jgi:serine O-acetyltransferase